MVYIVIAESVLLLLTLVKGFSLYREIYNLQKEKKIKMAQISFLNELNRKKECGLKAFFKEKQISTVAVYGIGMIYRAIEEELQKAVEVKIYVDKYVKNVNEMHGKPVVGMQEIVNHIEDVDAVLITPVGFQQEICAELKKYGVPNNKLIDAEDVIYYDKGKKCKRIC